jgi:hypothetical protein
MNRGISLPTRVGTEDRVPEKLTKRNLSLGKVLIIIPHIPLPIRITIKTFKIKKKDYF